MLITAILQMCIEIRKLCFKVGVILGFKTVSIDLLHINESFILKESLNVADIGFLDAPFVKVDCPLSEVVSAY
jgi:hypothetical protein